MKTIVHHLKRPWEWTENDQRYFFCETADCAVVYFGEGGSIVSKSDGRGIIGGKEDVEDSPVCYCFTVSTREAAADPALREFVPEMTRLGLCACETRNPSGRCRLKDFPRGEPR